MSSSRRLGGGDACFEPAREGSSLRWQSRLGERDHFHGLKVRVSRALDLVVEVPVLREAIRSTQKQSRSAQMRSEATGSTHEIAVLHLVEGGRRVLGLHLGNLLFGWHREQCRQPAHGFEEALEGQATLTVVAEHLMTQQSAQFILEPSPPKVVMGQGLCRG